MKNLFFLLGTMLLLQACGGGSGNAGTNATNANGISKEGLELKELGNGYQMATKMAGDKIKEQGVMRNGKRNGTWVIYNTEKGTPMSIANFIDDAYSGPYFKYNNYGQLELACTYVNNELDGYFVKYERAKKSEEGYYANGKEDGLHTKYYIGKDNKPQQALNYKDGKLHGSAKYFNEQGELIMEYTYENGEKISGGIVEKEPTE